jgi:hypothetical protein
VVPRAAGFSPAFVVGAPSLLQTEQIVALPLGAVITGVDVTPGDRTRLDVAGLPMPVQPRRFDVPDDGHAPIRNPCRPAAVALDHHWLSNAYPRELVTLGYPGILHGVQVVSVVVRPLQWDPRTSSFLLYPMLRYTVRFTLHASQESAVLREVRGISLRFLTSVATVQRVPGVFTAANLTPALTVGAVTPGPVPILQPFVMYLIITDDRPWPSTQGGKKGLTTVPPQVAEAGTPINKDVSGLGIVDHFKRLAEWKAAKGLTARVVTITEILSGTYGDFTQNGFARDLQEVIRNFIKHAYSAWRTEYVLLGGDVNIVPIRNFIGNVFGPSGGWDFTRDTANPPPSRKFVMASSNIAKLKFDTGLVNNEPEQWTNKYSLCAATSGTLIPFNSSSNAEGTRWYFVPLKEFDDSTKTSGYTRLDKPDVNDACIVVEGDAGTVNDAYGFYWIWDNRMLPSDFYYASLEGAQYGTKGRHDFDPLNIGVYGQCRWDESVGYEVPLNNGWDIWPDVCVGRVPARTAIEAAHFVDKLVSYERLLTVASPLDATSAGQPRDTNFLDEILYVTTRWYPDTMGSLDSSVTQKEALRAQMKTWFPFFSEESRYYEDQTDTDDPAVKPFSSAEVKAAVQKSPHIVSLTGHGSQSGCCGLDWVMDLPNTERAFIAYANSCSTASPDEYDHSFGEVCVVAPGGAVAYVGNGRTSGTEYSCNFEERFWCALRAYGRPGLAAGLRQAAHGFHSQWESFMKAYYGCPEMPAWIDRPKVQVLAYPTSVKLSATLSMWVGDGAGRKLANHTVTLLGGWTNTGTVFFQTRRSGTDGTVTFKMPAHLSVNHLTATAVAEGYVPYVGRINIIPGP